MRRKGVLPVLTGDIGPSRTDCRAQRHPMGESCFTFENDCPWCPEAGSHSIGLSQTFALARIHDESVPFEHSALHDVYSYTLRLGSTTRLCFLKHGDDHSNGAQCVYFRVDVKYELIAPNFERSVMTNRQPEHSATRLSLITRTTS